MKGKQNPIVDGQYLLCKFPGKGGWTYAEIPEVKPSGRIPFGWVRVNGSIDSYELMRCKLMPMGNGQLFLPVKASIRHSIAKSAGDYVRIVLYSDEYMAEIPVEIMDCFRNEPKKVFDNFCGLDESDQNDFLNWIYDAKTDEQKASRVVEMMDKLKSGLSLYSRS